MKLASALAFSFSLAALSCRSTSEPQVVTGDAETRAQLLDAVKGLEGRWRAEGETAEPMVHVFSVGSNGSAVREIMFPGEPHEMTNMYTLDGDALLMTHYCAGGNQPHMRATAMEGNAIPFRTAGVSDLKSADEVYMGEMTLVLVDANHIEERWRAFKNGEPDHETVFRLERVR